MGLGVLLFVVSSLDVHIKQFAYHLSAPIQIAGYNPRSPINRQNVREKQRFFFSKGNKSEIKLAILNQSYF